MTMEQITAAEDDRFRDLTPGTPERTTQHRGVEEDGDRHLRRYTDTVLANPVHELASRVRSLRRALLGAIGALEHAGYTVKAYCALDEAERSSPTWRAVRKAWEAAGHGPRYYLRFAPGTPRPMRVYPTRHAALEAAIEALEMCEGYPEAIELEGGARIMDCSAILRAWEDRHDPG